MGRGRTSGRRGWAGGDTSVNRHSVRHSDTSVRPGCQAVSTVDLLGQCQVVSMVSRQNRHSDTRHPRHPRHLNSASLAPAVTLSAASAGGMIHELLEESLRISGVDSVQLRHPNVRIEVRVVLLVAEKASAQWPSVHLLSNEPHNEGTAHCESSLFNNEGFGAHCCNNEPNNEPPARFREIISPWEMPNSE